jgi:hypothetical protein
MVGSLGTGDQHMQQANRAEQSTVNTHGATLPGAAPLNAFVINLCSSTSPVALSPPDHAGLKRFSFFVSRRREESRERFRLHMGYFDTQEEAEKLLDIVREIYPGAWAGLAPGQRLRAAAAQARSAPAPAAHASAAPARPDPQPAPMPAADAADAVVSEAATEAGSHAAEAADSGNTAALALLPDEGRRIPDSPLLKPEIIGAARSLNDVRAAIASLEDTSERAPTLRPIPELKPASAASSGLASARAADAAKDSSDPISDSGVLAVLERGAVAAPAPSARTPVIAAGTGTANSTATTGSTVAMAAPAQMRAGERAWEAAEEEAPPRVEKPYFAVQLMWSVQPMDIAQVPQLAIFSAYTLYGAEGNRDGRRWYGLRLGFFTDAVSAKQVAHYVRSEFSTVSVVPVTARERERAHLASGRPSVVAPAKAVVPVNVAAPAHVAGPAHVAAPAHPAAPATPPRTKFEFIEDRGITPAPGTKPGSGSARPGRSAPGKRAKLRTQTGVNGRAKSKPMTLEETLEILGAGELKMDDGRQPLINDSGVGRVKPAKNKSSRLGRLFERLSERMGS